jgi:CubicO group peptidase (beta-lactamase class C family)
MERFLQKKEGPKATILKMLQNEVYKPIGVEHFATGTGYTPSGEVGFPFCGWGALPTIEYLAKTGTLVANMGKAEDGTQILDADLIADFSTNPEYQFAFWKTEYTSHAGEALHIPTMSGAGGNYVLSMPNGLVGIALGCNSYNFGWTDDQRRTIAAAADNLRPF